MLDRTKYLYFSFTEDSPALSLDIHEIFNTPKLIKSLKEKNFRERTKSFWELFPRFDELENGTYPTLLDIADYYTIGFNFQRFFMQSLPDDNEFLQLILLKRTPTVHPNELIDEEEATLCGNFADIYSGDFEDVYDFYEEPYPEYVPEANEPFDDEPTQVASEMEQIVPDSKPKKPKKQVRFMDPESQTISYDVASPIVENGANQISVNPPRLDKNGPQLNGSSKISLNTF